MNAAFKKLSMAAKVAWEEIKPLLELGGDAAVSIDRTTFVTVAEVVKGFADQYDVNGEWVKTSNRGKPLKSVVVVNKPDADDDMGMYVE